MTATRRVRAATVTLAMAAPLLALVAQPADGQDDAFEPKPVGIVVLVDESGSLGDDGVKAEQDATAIIAQTEFATGSRIAVVGFGGNNGRPNQAAAQVRCQPTVVTGGPERDYLSQCVKDLHRRSLEEGNSTDFPSALLQGLDLLKDMPDVSARIVFLLTDGELDVRDDDSYGRPQDRQDAAMLRMDEYLAEAAARDVQVWPLGFGNVVREQLDDFAAGGSQRTCGPNSPRPAARIVTDAAAVRQSLTEVYAASRCAGVNPAVSASLGPGATVTLDITVPEIATDGSIAVYKGNPAVKVSYQDPAGDTVPKAGSLGDSQFQVSGESSPVEVLRIRSPQPGPWKVMLTAPAGVAEEVVSATVIWQGVVRSSLVLDPPQPRAGEVTTIDVTLRTRRGALVDEDALRGVSAAATLSGSGFTPVDVVLVPQGDGRFQAQLAVPATATGELLLVGTVSGTGIATDERTLRTNVNAGEPVRGQVSLDDQLVPPGGQLNGSVALTNPSGVGRRVLLQLSELDSGTLVTVSPSSADMVSGSGRIDFGLVFAADTRLGSGQAVLRVVDEADPAVRYVEKVITFEVGYPPGPLRRLWWLWALLAASALVAVLVLAHQARQRRRRTDVGGLHAQLFSGGRMSYDLPAPGEQSARFRFVIRRTPGEPAQLHHATAADEPYVVRRDHSGGVQLQQPDGEIVVLRFGEHTDLPDALSLAFLDSSREADGELDGSPPWRLPWPRRQPAEEDYEYDAPDGDAVPTIATDTPGDGWTRRRQPDDDLL